MKIATTIGEMYSYCASPAEAIELYRDTGFRYLDYSFYNVLSTRQPPLLEDSWEKHIYDALSAAETNGFSFVQAHAPSGPIVGPGSEECLLATQRSIEACGILGIRNMVIHSAFIPTIHYPDGAQEYFKTNEPFFRALIPSMEANNVSILFENTTIKHCANHSYFPILGQDLNDFISFMDHPLFGAAWDVGHANMDSIDHETEIMTMGRNLKAIHVHDNNGQRDQHIAPFLGTTDYDSLLRGLIRSGYEGYFTLESDGFLKYNRSETLSGPLAHPTLEMKRAALSFLYSISEQMLRTYQVFEA